MAAPSHRTAVSAAINPSQRCKLIFINKLRQDVRTSGLMWSVQRILAFVSRYITLAPGDVISTGSGGGNALTGPGDYMKPGQVVRCQAEGIGELANPVAARTWRSEIPPLPPL